MEPLPETLKNEILGLGSLNEAKLREKYGDLLGDARGCKSSGILRQLIAYRLQERFYGVAISKDAEDWMSGPSDGATLGIKNNPSGMGARLVRNWKGIRHEVRIMECGQYEYNGSLYKSLSAVARAITGTQWNGKLFFGVK